MIHLYMHSIWVKKKIMLISISFSMFVIKTEMSGQSPTHLWVINQYLYSSIDFKILLKPLGSNFRGVHQNMIFLLLFTHIWNTDPLQQRKPFFHLSLFFHKFCLINFRHAYETLVASSTEISGAFPNADSDRLADRLSQHISPNSSELERIVF